MLACAAACSSDDMPSKLPVTNVVSAPAGGGADLPMSSSARGGGGASGRSSGNPTDMPKAGTGSSAGTGGAGVPMLTAGAAGRMMKGAGGAGGSAPPPDKPPPVGSGSTCLQPGNGNYLAPGPYQVGKMNVDLGMIEAGQSSGKYTIYYPTPLETNCLHPIV